MIRTTLAKAYIKRTFRPLYGWTQMTPKSAFLDSAWDRSVDIWPGMGLMRTSGENYTLLNATGVPAGFCGHYIGGDDVDEVRDQGVNALSVWVMGPDAEAEVLAPAFDDALTWDDPGDGTELLIHVQTAGATRGKLVPAGTAGASTDPICRLMKVVSDTKIIVGGLITRA